MQNKLQAILQFHWPVIAKKQTNKQTKKNMSDNPPYTCAQLNSSNMWLCSQETDTAKVPTDTAKMAGTCLRK